MDWIDDTERELIIKFFSVDPIDVITPDSNSYVLGISTFRNVIDFYKFEYKVHERVFWDMLLPAVNMLPDKEVPLAMSKVDVGYPWLDYVTSVDIQYTVQYNKLHITIQPEADPYQQALILICNMMFVSDFHEVKGEYSTVHTHGAWLDIIKRTHDYQQSLLHRPV
jgi:hypothetical protein